MNVLKPEAIVFPILFVLFVAAGSKVDARTRAECNSIYNGCVKLCDKYGATPKIVASCIGNCGKSAQQCHDTASEAGGNRTMTMGDGAGDDGNTKPKVPTFSPGLLDSSSTLSAGGGPAPGGQSGGAPAPFLK